MKPEEISLLQLSTSEWIICKLEDHTDPTMVNMVHPFIYNPYQMTASGYGSLAYAPDGVYPIPRIAIVFNGVPLPGLAEQFISNLEKLLDVKPTIIAPESKIVMPR